MRSDRITKIILELRDTKEVRGIQGNGVTLSMILTDEDSEVKNYGGAKFIWDAGYYCFVENS